MTAHDLDRPRVPERRLIAARTRRSERLFRQGRESICAARSESLNGTSEGTRCPAAGGLGVAPVRMGVYFSLNRALSDDPAWVVMVTW
jgi:hypothetical protein